MLPLPRLYKTFLLQAGEKAKPHHLYQLCFVFSATQQGLNYRFPKNTTPAGGITAAKTNQSLHQVYNVKISAKLYSWLKRGREK